jgi:hypothetical protein
MKSMELHPKVLAFAEQMQTELNNNAHKGDWDEFRDVKEIIHEFEYHKAKLILALGKKEPHQECKELIADCANILMFLGNSGNLY